MSKKGEYIPPKKRATKFLTEMEIARLKKLCETFSQADAARIVGCTQTTVYKLKKRGWQKFSPRKNARQRPSDFSLRASEMTIDQLARHYRTSLDYVYRWLDGVERKYDPKWSKRSFDVPADFVALWPTMQSKQLAQHYSVSRETIVKWRDRCGLPSKWSEKKLRNFVARKRAEATHHWAEHYFDDRRAA